MSKSDSGDHAKNASRWTPTRTKAFKVVAWYAVAGLSWLVLSDWLVGCFVHGEGLAEALDVAGDVIFVVVTAAMLAWLQGRYFREIRRFAKAVQDNETRLRVMGDNLPDSFIYQYTHDAEGNPQFTYVSVGVERVLGVKVDDVLRDSKCVLEKLDPKQLPSYLAAEAESARNLTDFDMELRAPLSDGNVRLIRARSRPRRDEQGRVLWDGFATDITERRRIESDQAVNVARYRSLFDNMLNGFAHCQMIFEDEVPVDFIYVDVNPAFRKLTGLSNVIGKMASEVIPGIHATDPGLLARYGRVAKTGVPEQFETYVEAMNIWFSISVYCPAKEHFVSVFDVITERKVAETALHEREQQLRLFVEHCPAGIAMLNRDMRYLVVSRRWRVDGQLGDRNIIGKNHYEIFPEIPETRKAIHQRCLAGAIEKNEADTIPRADGSTDWVRWEIRPWHTTQGDVGGLIIFSEVITERVRTMENLRESEEKFHQLADNITDVFWMTSPDSKALHYVSPAYERVWGRSVASLYAQPTQWSDAIVPEEREQVFAVFSRLRDEAMDVDLDYRISRPNGSIRWIHDRGFQIRDSAGKLVRIGGIASDITERKQAEEALRESEKKLRILFECSRDAILTTDPASARFTSGNPASLEMFGAGSEAELITCSPASLSPELQPDGRLSSEKVKACNEAVLRDGVHFFEWKHRRFNGEEFFADVLLTRIERDGKPAVMASVRDTTERKQAEMALRQSEEQFRAMFETASVGMGQANPDTGKFERVNRKMCEITGYSHAEMLQLRVPEITHPHDRERDWELFQRVARGESSSYHIEKRYIRNDQKTVWVSVNMTLIRDAAGRPLRTMATIEDITERRKADEERMRLSTALEQAAESIVITNLAGMILFVNPAFEKITGYSKREVIGQNPRLLKSGKHDEAFYKQMWNTLGRGRVWHGRFINRRKDGTLYEEDATISPVRDASGKIVNYMAIKLDISREVELENQLRQTQKLEAIGQLAGGVAHDFNNILTSILMQVELGNMEENLSGDLREGLHQIRHDAERAASLTRQLLLFSRRQVMQSRDLDLNETVTNLAKMLQRIIGEDVRLQLHLNPAPLMTHADAGMLDQVAMNLAVNARDAMPEGGCLLIATSEKVLDEEMARRHPDTSPGRYACLSVTDTGTGIPADVLPRIFEPFFTTKGVGKGTGLGLATVFGIIKQHGGWISVETEPGRGTTFHVFLPALTGTAVMAMAEPDMKLRGGTETILLTEDEAVVRNSLRSILVRSGYTVLEAVDGESALNVWDAHRATVDLLLTDLVMPGGVGGQQLARLLQKDDPTLKVVYISGYSAEIAGREITLDEGETFMQKPLNPVKLLETVRNCLDGVVNERNGMPEAQF